MCEGVATEDAENSAMLQRGIIRTIKCHIDSSTPEELWENSPVLPWLVEHAGSILSMCKTGRDGRMLFESLHGKKPSQEFVPCGEKVLARQMPPEPVNRMTPRYKFGISFGMSNIFVIGEPWRLTSGRWTVDMPEAFRSNPHSDIAICRSTRLEGMNHKAGH